MSLILKAEFNGEIRRVGLKKDDDATVEKLEAKLRTLFPQLGESFLMTCSTGDFHTDADVAQAFVEAAGKKPPLVRISVDPNQARRVSAPVVETEYVQIPSTTEQAFADWTSISPSISLGHKCRLCDASLERVHFKCLNCLDVEICAQCEEAQLHDPSHLFVKMRCHVDSLPLKRQLIFKSHIDNPNERELAKEEKKKLREKKTEIDNRKKEAREAERKKRAQEKLKRLQARKEKVSNKKVKVTAAEKKKVTAVSKVKRAKKIVALAPVEEVAEPVNVAEEVVEEPVTTSVELPKEEVSQEKQDFNFLRFLSEFHLLKEVVKQDDQHMDQPEEEKIEIELQEIREEQPEEETKQQEEIAAQPEEERKEKETPFAKNLKVLEEMGFTDREKNVELLVRNVGNLDETINQLLNPQPFAALSRWLPFAISL